MSPGTKAKQDERKRKGTVQYLNNLAVDVEDGKATVEILAGKTETTLIVRRVGTSPTKA